MYAWKLLYQNWNCLWEKITWKFADNQSIHNFNNNCWSIYHVFGWWKIFWNDCCNKYYLPYSHCIFVHLHHNNHTFYIIPENDGLVVHFQPLLSLRAHHHQYLYSKVKRRRTTKNQQCSNLFWRHTGKDQMFVFMQKIHCSNICWEDLFSCVWFFLCNKLFSCWTLLLHFLGGRS